jgi:putative component of toxin-antitoxin plasmid stabilization module
VFFAVEGNCIVLLLGGYDKGTNPSPRRQDKEIKRAREVLAEHRQTE